MLKPAQLYKEELDRKFIEQWYNPKNIYWNGGSGDSLIQLPDSNFDHHCFVSVDKNNEVIGYIGYWVDWQAMNAHSFGMLCFKEYSITFARDIYQAISDLFEKYNMNRVAWFCYTDNPAIRGYRNFIKKYGGRECGCQRQITKLMDGKLHDMAEFEILRSEWKI